MGSIVDTHFSHPAVDRPVFAGISRESEQWFVIESLLSVGNSLSLSHWGNSHLLPIFREKCFFVISDFHSVSLPVSLLHPFFPISIGVLPVTPFCIGVVTVPITFECHKESFRLSAATTSNSVSLNLTELWAVLYCLGSFSCGIYLESVWLQQLISWRCIHPIITLLYDNFQKVSVCLFGLFPAC